MKKNFVAKVFVVLLAFIMVFSFCGFSTIKASAATNNNLHDGLMGVVDSKRPEYVKLIKYFKSQARKENFKKFWRDGIKELKKVESYDKALAGAIGNVFEIIEDPQNADWTEVGMETLKSAVNIFASCYGLGGVSDAIFDGVMNFGDDPQSEMQILQGHLDDQFDEVHKHLDDIQSDIADLSTQVDDSTKEILEALANALEADYAKAQVINFMSSSEGNFNYTQFKNYLYGQTDGSENPYYYTQAYYNKLVESIVGNSSNEVIKENYNALYRSLASTAQHGDANINMLYDYLLYNEQSGKESIQRYYYDYLLSNRELLGDRNAEYEALQFTLDLYTTALFADHCIAMCNNYQLMCIYEIYGTNPSLDVRYVYGTGNNDYITYGELLQNSAAIDRRQTDLEVQMVSDVAYIINMEGSVVIEDDNHNTHIISNSDKTTFGSVQINQTIYLNKMFDDVCTAFGFESNDFSYEWYSGKQYIGANDGVLKVNGFYSSFEGVVKYNGEKVYSIPFEIKEFPTFNGGDGSEEDPYVISNAEQFNLIATAKDGMNKHYILIDDIDFDEVLFTPIGNEDKPFNGSLDGNGYSIKNIKVSANEYVGLFGYVGLYGEIKNLNVEKSTFTVNSKNFEQVYAGAIAAVNEGSIWNCCVINSSVSIEETSDLLNKHLYAYAGGVAGFSVGNINYCKVDNTKIATSLVRNYGSEGDGKNSTNAYAGGIVAAIAETGTVTSCYANDSTKISASATSTCHDSFSTRHPYITVRAAGIVATFSNITKIEDVWSDAVIEKCEYHRENTAATGNTMTNNCSAKSDSYVPEINDEQKAAIKAETKEAIVFPSQTLNYDITYSFDCEFDEKYNCYVDQLYYCNEEAFKIDNLNILINGEDVEYAIMAYYNFNTFNSDISTAKVNTVTVVFVTQYENEIIVDKLQLPITITENSACGLEVSVIPNKTTYKKDEVVSITGGSIVLKYQDGSTKDVTSSVALSYDTSKYGKSQVTVSYGDFTTTYDIVVDCTHNYNGTIVNSTCTTIGYTVYTCEHCMDTYKTDFTGKAAHTTVAQNEISSTCTAEGKYADAFCVICEQIIKFGEAIAPTGHNYAEGTTDSGTHYCKSCGHGEEHLFRTTEYETEVLCTCVICDYVAKFDANSRDKISKLPRIVVSDAYSLNGENEIVVYLELYSNVGITSACFSVYFGDELELVGYSYGNILYKPSASAFKEYPDHLNVSLAQANTEVANPNYEASNTLLKLVFRTPKDATTGKEYPILIVNKAENSNGTTKFVDKFTSSTGEPLDFIALNGKIKVVDRLPGDVIGDGTIDLLDAVIISKYSVLEGADRTVFLENMNSIYNAFDISYGDVTLDNIYTNADVVQILRYIVGGYEARILAKEFYINLNYNDGTGNESNISARYDENGNIILNGLPIVERDGYRFDGWYYGFGKDANKLDGNYLWNYDAIEQTLYAHYTLNSISFDGNGATIGNMDSITYGDMDEWSVDNEFEKISNVYFDSKYSEKNERISLNHAFKGWALSPNGDIVYGAGQIISLKDDEIGDLTLYAIWSTEYITLPSLDRTGYKLGAWTIDKEGFSIAGNVNSNYPITSDTTLYAKWNLIQYTIIYNGNGHTSGNTVGSTIYDIEQGRALAPNNFYRTGYSFNGWNTKADGSGKNIPDRSEVSYIGTEIGTVVTLYAQWVKNKYEIIFNSNFPSIVKTSIYKGKSSGTMSSLTECWYDTNVVLTKNEFTVEGWKFEGWTTSADGSLLYLDGSTQQNLASEDAAKVNLYAVWKVDPYTIGKYVSNGAVVSDTNGENSYTVYNVFAETPQLTCKGKVIVDWRDCPDGENNYAKAVVNSNGDRYGGGNTNLDIAYGVTEAFFIGNPKAKYHDVHIYTVSYPVDSTLTIHMKDMNFSSGSGIINSWYGDFSQDVGMYLTIDCLGTNTITATSSGATAILNHKNLAITGSGNLTITAGNGADATTAGGNGSKGGTAIIVDNLTVDMEETGTLTVYGGNGGNGAKGKDQSLSHENSNPPEKATTDGGSGGDGGTAISCTSITITQKGTVVLIGGTGGNGGNGGNAGDGYGGYQKEVGTLIAGSYDGYAKLPAGANGGNGGNGGSPLECEEAIKISKNSILTLQYGNGGNGGNGGQGGDAAWHKSGIKPDTGGNGGKGGNGGNGYAGGKGGNGGKGGISFSNEGDWGKNQYGTSGDGGDAGAGGDALSKITYSHGTVSSNYSSVGKGGNGGACGDKMNESKFDIKYGEDKSSSTGSSGHTEEITFEFDIIK